MTEETIGSVNDEKQLEDNDGSSVNLGQHRLAATKARLDAIRAGIKDPESDPAEVCRLISFEIAVVTQSMLSRRFAPEDGYLIRAYAKQVKALRELAKQILQAEVWRRKEDILDFDGKKFKFVLGRIVHFFAEAMKEAGVPDDLRASGMRHYRDLMAKNEPLIRRETEKLGTNKTS